MGNLSFLRLAGFSVVLVGGGLVGCVGDSPTSPSGDDAGGSDAGSSDGGGGDAATSDGAATDGAIPTDGSAPCEGQSACLESISGWAAVTYVTGNGQLACPTGGVELRRGGVNPPSTLSCTPCACGQATCSSSTIELWDQSSSCASSPAVTLSLASSSCLNAQQSAIMYSMRFTPGTTSCPASGGVKQPFAWGTNVLTCTAAVGSGTCSGGACFLKPSAPAALCIAKDGDVACPSQTYAKHVFHTGVVDTTSCGQCTCNGNGAACTGSAGIFFSPNCTNPFNTVNPVPVGCKATNGGNAIGSFQSAANSAGCTPVGGAASGSIAVDPAKAVTVCCPP